MFAMHVEHKEWTFWQEYTVASKFRGKYLVCYPLGGCHIVMHRSQSHYTSNKAATTIHNIIVGKLWIDQVCVLLDIIIMKFLLHFLVVWRCENR